MSRDFPRYIQIRPDELVLEHAVKKPYKAILVIDFESGNDLRTRVCDWLVSTGCRYALCWGNNCDAWEDWIDQTSVMRALDHPDAAAADEVLMTTSHANDDLSQMFWFSKNCAFVEGVDFQEVLILHVSHEDKATELLEVYRLA
jgi:hypothetical protein